jgi:hypothetical protein
MKTASEGALRCRKTSAQSWERSAWLAAACGGPAMGAVAAMVAAPADRSVAEAPAAARWCGIPTTTRRMHDMARRCDSKGEGAVVELASLAMVATTTVACARASKNGEANGERLLPSHVREEERAMKEHTAAMVGCVPRMAATKAFPQTPGGHG